jgi:ankyrin repeat protein
MAAPQEVGAIFRRATERGPEEVARLLDAQPHLIKARGVQGTTFLMEAAGYGRVEIVTLLLARGADVALMNGRGGTALYIAGVSGHREVASVLLSSGADLWRTGFHGRTPLIAASKGCQEAMVILFVGHMGGRGLDEVDMDGCTALWYACGAGLVEASKALLLAGADHTIDSIWGQTPQDIARQRFRRDCVDLIQVSPSRPICIPSRLLERVSL